MPKDATEPFAAASGSAPNERVTNLCHLAVGNLESAMFGARKGDPDWAAQSCAWALKTLKKAQKLKAQNKD